jgi:hypothetical protein
MTTPQNYSWPRGGLGIRLESKEKRVAGLVKALVFQGPATVEVMTAVELI